MRRIIAVGLVILFNVAYIAGRVDGAIAAPAEPVILMGAGDIAHDGVDADGDQQSLQGAESTGSLIANRLHHYTFGLGDLAYSEGTRQQFDTLYHPTWGILNPSMRPIPGNHEYRTPGAAGYTGYFDDHNVRIRNAVNGGLYYAWTPEGAPGWRVYMINTENQVPHGVGSAQYEWARADAAKFPNRHRIIMTHHPRYNSTTVGGGETDIVAIWKLLNSNNRLELVLAGHSHAYERFPRMNADGGRTTRGAVSIVAGTGGAHMYASPETVLPLSQYRNSTDHGIVRVALRPSGFSIKLIASGRGWEHNGPGSLDDVPVATGNRGVILDEFSWATK